MLPRIRRWADPEYRANRKNAVVSNETRKKLSEIMKAKWRDGSYRARVMVNGSHSEERRQKISNSIKEKWQDSGYRSRALEASARSSTPLHLREKHRSTCE